MRGINLFTGNRLENLSRALATVLSTPVGDVFSKELVVVQSQGMSRWISLELAKYHGVCANVSYRFPNAFIYDVLKGTTTDPTNGSAYDPLVMTWKIMKHLPDLLHRQEFHVLRNYLDHTAGKLKLFQLSERISDTFDQYLLFRPEMVLSWEEGGGDDWQPLLWREIIKNETGKHRVGLFSEFSEKASGNQLNSEAFPPRISVFGISAIPKFHMDILKFLSDFTQVNLFLMNPCREYWGEIFSDREIKRIKARQKKESVESKDLHLERGNSLLASMGSLGREFYGLINEYDHSSYEVFQEPGEETLLECIQSDILNLKERCPDAEEKRRIDRRDRSIAVNSCHSAMREMEVLRDELYRMLEEDPALTPADILVMTPDIEIYAPLVQAVFDKTGGNVTPIPFSIADRGFKNESRIAESFLSLIKLFTGRFEVAEVFDIFEREVVRKRFGLSEKDVDTALLWAKDAGIRWGRDETFRKTLGFPAYKENSWLEGFGRMFLGYAMPGFGEKLFDKTLPYDNIEGENAHILGKFYEFVHNLFLFSEESRQSKNPEGWSRFLLDLLETFFDSTEENQGEIQLIRSEILGLSQATGDAQFEEGIDFSVIRFYLEKCLGQVDMGFGFITGGITFCAMLPMRSIPFKVICMVGMDGIAYPRETKSPGFDLIAANPRPGDRSRRKDDRYLFLEALLSARDRLYISYTGQSIRDNSTLQPSVLVSELMDYINEGFEIEGGSIIEEHLFLKHPLQPFCPRYFKDNSEENRLFSYSGQNFHAARRLVEIKTDPEPFIGHALSDPEEGFLNLDISTLASFFRNPSKFLLTRRLGLAIKDKTVLSDNKEPFFLGGLERYQVENDLLEKNIRGTFAGDYFKIARASGQLPYGSVGKRLFQQAEKGVDKFTETLSSYVGTQKEKPVSIDLNIDRFTLSGTMDSIYNRTAVNFRYGSLRGIDLVSAWLKHLALNVENPEGFSGVSILAGIERNKTGITPLVYEFSPVANPRETLHRLLQIYLEGLKKPLRFFPKSSCEFARQLFSPKGDQEKAMKAASKTLLGDDYRPGELDDPFYEICFRNQDPLDQDFIHNSTTVFEPLLDTMEKRDV